ncbi:MAG TPA: DoxX family protein [bacterium]|nr:DoxX family protein [bacterium]
MSSATIGTGAQSSGKGLRIATWVVQGLLILAFGMAGTVKSTQPLAALATQMPWTTQVPGWLVRFIGISELLGAIGLLLPAATRILPVLTPIAASALVVVMVLAAGFHAMHGEPQMMAPSIVLGLLSAFVAWSRFTRARIEPRR